ncbi:MAG: hypothetical protein M1823_008858, partial [Watsoniomyces obsoletus]
MVDGEIKRQAARGVHLTREQAADYVLNLVARVSLAVQVYEQTVVVLDWTRGAVLATILLSSCFLFVFLIVGLFGILWCRLAAELALNLVDIDPDA